MLLCNHVEFSEIAVMLNKATRIHKKGTLMFLKCVCGKIEQASWYIKWVAFNANCTFIKAAAAMMMDISLA